MNNFRFEKIKCPVCEADDPKFLGWRGGEAHQSGSGVKTAIVRCGNCSHQYPNPMPFPEGDLSELYVDADEYFRGHDVEKKKQGGVELMREFERRLGKKGRFLDVGCGVGELLWAANECGWDAHGIDPSKEFIEIGSQRLGVQGQVATLEEANFPSEYFDAVIMGGIIEHLYNPLETLKEIHRILKPKGWFWFDAPNEDGLYMKMGNFYMRLRGKDWVVTLAPTFPPYHVQGFNLKSIKTIIERADFDLKELEIVGEISGQTGKQTLRKNIEYNGARFINWLGKLTGKGMYMSAWAQKK
jgi:SAM-dependent methyltransferase